MKHRQIDPQTSLEAMAKTGPLLARAKAERTYLEEYRKSLKALLMKSSGETVVSAQEREAYAHQDYVTHLTALRTAVEQEERLRWHMVTAETAIAVWRSMEASNRAIDKGAA